MAQTKCSIHQRCGRSNRRASKRPTMEIGNLRVLAVPGRKNSNRWKPRNNAARLRGSGCAPLVPVVKSANLRYRDHGSQFRRLHRPWFRRVFGQGEVRPGLVIIPQERLDVLVQGRLAEDNHMIQALTPNSANHPFHVGSLPRRTRSRKHLLDPHGFHIGPKFRAEDAVAVSEAGTEGPARKGKDSRSCCAVHSAVGWAVTLKCTIRLRS